METWNSSSAWCGPWFSTTPSPCLCGRTKGTMMPRSRRQSRGCWDGFRTRSPTYPSPTLTRTGKMAKPWELWWTAVLQVSALAPAGACSTWSVWVSSLRLCCDCCERQTMGPRILFGPPLAGLPGGPIGTFKWQTQAFVQIPHEGLSECFKPALSLASRLWSPTSSLIGS